MLESKCQVLKQPVACKQKQHPHELPAEWEFKKGENKPVNQSHSCLSHLTDG